METLTKLNKNFSANSYPYIYSLMDRYYAKNGNKPSDIAIPFKDMSVRVFMKGKVAVMVFQNATKVITGMIILRKLSSGWRPSSMNSNLKAEDLNHYTTIFRRVQEHVKFKK